jgi:UrcA family protein
LACAPGSSPGAAAVACILVSGIVSAKDAVVAIRVSARGLDLSQSADARRFYARLEHAAWVACTDGNRVDLEPSDDPQRCYERALAGAIHTAEVPTLTQIYVYNHTLQDAEAFGILVPTQTASKR